MGKDVRMEYIVARKAMEGMSSIKKNMFDGTPWYDDRQTAEAIDIGVANGLLNRVSHSQVEWTQKGVDFIYDTANAMMDNMRERMEKRNVHKHGTQMMIFIQSDYNKEDPSMDGFRGKVNRWLFSPEGESTVFLRDEICSLYEEGLFYDPKDITPSLGWDNGFMEVDSSILYSLSVGYEATQINPITQAGKNDTDAIIAGCSVKNGEKTITVTDKNQRILTSVTLNGGLLISGGIEREKQNQPIFERNESKDRYVLIEGLTFNINDIFVHSEFGKYIKGIIDIGVLKPIDSVRNEIKPILEETVKNEEIIQTGVKNG